MAISDRATEAQEKKFKKSKEEILEVAFEFLASDKYSYLKEVLESLGTMVAFYSYGNGEISVWHNLSEDEEYEVLDIFEPIIKANIGISLTRNGCYNDPYGGDLKPFRTQIWFE